MTFIEVLLVVVISSMLLLPLLGWMTTTIRTSTRVQEQSATSRDRNLLSTYLNRDVAAAASAQLGGTDCAGGSGSGGTVLVELRSATSVRSVYTVVESLPGSGAVWRRTCAADGSETRGTRVVERAVTPAGGWATSATCAERRGRSGDTCGSVTLRFALPRNDRIEVTFHRRIGGAQ